MAVGGGGQAGHGEEHGERRSVRLEATIRPPTHLRAGDLLDRVIGALRGAGIGVDSSSLRELGAFDPEGED